MYIDNSVLLSLLPGTAANITTKCNLSLEAEAFDARFRYIYCAFWTEQYQSPCTKGTQSH